MSFPVKRLWHLHHQENQSLPSWLIILMNWSWLIPSIGTTQLMMSMKETTLLQIQQQQQQSEAENKRKLSSSVTGLLNMDIFTEDTSRKISNCEVSGRHEKNVYFVLLNFIPSPCDTFYQSCQSYEKTKEMMIHERRRKAKKEDCHLCFSCWCICLCILDSLTLFLCSLLFLSSYFLLSPTHSLPIGCFNNWWISVFSEFASGMW